MVTVEFDVTGEQAEELLASIERSRLSNDQRYRMVANFRWEDVLRMEASIKDQLRNEEAEVRAKQVEAAARND